MLDLTALNTQISSGNAVPVQQFSASCRHTDTVGSPAARTNRSQRSPRVPAPVLRVAT